MDDDPSFQNRTTLKYDVVIITRNRPAEIRKVLHSISLQTVPPAEIIIIDASDNDATKNAVGEISKRHAKFPIAWHKSTVASTTYQRNRGIEKAHHDITFFIDDDVTLEPDFAKTILDTYQNHPEIAAVDGLEVNHAVHQKPYDLFCRFFLMNTTTAKKGSVLKASGFTDINESKKCREEFMCTCCTTIRRNILNRYRFDENLGSYAFMEDVDFSIPIGRNHIIMRNPDARFYHHQSPNSRISARSRQIKYVFNHYYIFRKHLPKNPVTIGAFLWSNIGLVLEAVYNLFKEKSFACLSGTFIGFWQIARHLISGKTPR